MKTTTLLSLMVSGAATVAMTVMATPNFGTDVFHYTVSATVTNEGIEPNASGSVAASLKQQGNADIQKLDIDVKGLTPGAPYELEALVDGDTNFVVVADFTAAADGSVSLHYQSAGNSQGNGKKQLPAELNPVNQIQGLVILNTNEQPVLAADLSAPHKLDYLLKSNLSTDDISAMLMIQANANHATVRLMASGLVTNSVYSLALDDAVVQTGTSSSKGKLTLTATSSSPLDILSVNTVSLLDSSTNIVVSTTLP